MEVKDSLAHRVQVLLLWAIVARVLGQGWEHGPGGRTEEKRKVQGGREGRQTSPGRVLRQHPQHGDGPDEQLQAGDEGGHRARRAQLVRGDACTAQAAKAKSEARPAPPSVVAPARPGLRSSCPRSSSPLAHALRPPSASQGRRKDAEAGHALSAHPARPPGLPLRRALLARPWHRTGPRTKKPKKPHLSPTALPACPP